MTVRLSLIIVLASSNLLIFRVLSGKCPPFHKNRMLSWLDSVCKDRQLPVQQQV
jgi:hypothetical protein